MQWIEQKLESPEARAGTRIFASLLIALSGLVPISDKLITLELANTFGFSDTSTFIWSLCQTLTPILMALGAMMKPYKISYSVPVYFYSIQLYWIFRPELRFDNVFTHIYATGCVVAFVLLVIFINNVFQKIDRAKHARIHFLEKALDLSIDLNKRS
ncbi:hypothetical protein [Ascidiimonas aurantiaca]|uniref:hypothetical protein n=1 Tax=Ascidiimonas aurantiaca TaxID=1685432 RepID=UPI0030EE3E79